MARVRGDPITTALAHPTRRALYIKLAQSDECSTVQLQSFVGVDRYNLYHHLKKLASLNLIENHRDQGRARWWKVADLVELPELIGTSNNLDDGLGITTEPQPSQPAIEQDRSSVILELEGSRMQISAKQLLTQLSETLGLQLDIPWSFIPEKIVLLGPKEDESHE